MDAHNHLLLVQVKTIIYMIKKYFIILPMFALLTSQNLPGTPNISWMPTEYELINENLNLTIS